VSKTFGHLNVVTAGTIWVRLPFTTTTTTTIIIIITIVVVVIIIIIIKLNLFARI